MNAQTKTQYFQIESRRIEVLVDQATSPKGLALIAHPHPLFGGTNQNKVVQTLARAFLEQGYDTWRPNFRGVGASEGVYDEGRGETEDFLALLQAAKTVYPNLGTEARCLALAGFSFGSFVASMAFEKLGSLALCAEKLVLIGPAASRFPMPAVPEHSIVIHGEDDEVVALDDVMAWARPLALPVLVFPQTSHFFHGRLPLLKQRVSQCLAQGRQN
ncbi:MAG: alpha/beta hydrolase [Betaproteobacteria bacterium]|nr:alpha/beta hydrolase [Pseudomonadota bacterium]NBO02683.1 alpha/beta hydrolase [Betaproteobacteria bacterium]NBO95452.1 alpha/beta hydrolase [Betaproteobacteria bacterium]NBP34913.1 alpha/beta hydrolase [Betaproteobacteria bacterium]NBP37804.1 alpha/beta hydrolase [Betaproteobacteria bacterium]